MNRIKAFVLAPFVAAFGFASYAQETIDMENDNIEISNVPVQKKKHRTKITLITGQKLKGTITSIGDKSIQLKKVVYKNSGIVHAAPGESMSFNEVNYNDIQTIKIRGSIGETIGGFLVGTVAGVIVGGLSVSCEDCNLDEELALIVIFAGLGGVIGGPIGAIDGPFIVHIKIAGQYSNYEKFRNEMEKKGKRRQKRF
jgi:hypothetical protein